MTRHEKQDDHNPLTPELHYLPDPEGWMQLIRERLAEIRERIAGAAARAGREAGAVGLVAVSKTQPASRVLAALAAGQTVFGESRLQEALPKMAAVSRLLGESGADPAGSPAGVEWHLIGHLQRNKAASAVGVFSLIHSVDSVRLIEELERQAARREIIQHLLLQVNVSGEASKAGATPGELPALLDALDGSPHLRGEGLMTIPPLFDAPDAARPHFVRLRELLAGIAPRPRFTPRHLSMGMSGDYEVAIEEGATLVRIGSSLFGSRE